MSRYSVTIATVNGSGSASANTLLAKMIFRSKYPLSAKNIFPSNIAGEPTWFTIRVDDRGFLSRTPLCQVFINRNKKTLLADLQKISDGGLFLLDSEFEQDVLSLPLSAQTKIKNLDFVAIPFRDLTGKLSSSVKMRRLLSNMVYVGAMVKLMGLSKDIALSTLNSHFGSRADLVDLNMAALNVGYEWATTELTTEKYKSVGQLILPLGKSETENKMKELLVDGNSAAALGAIHGGCTFLAWYPITPSSSLAENMIDFATDHRKNAEGKMLFAQVQAEDELSAINMVIGAGWSGARAMTATSGPGMSLMAEAAGLSYFAEIPAVIWNVQRAGPSTGLPTRTMQSDFRSATHLSHGDTQHVILLPSDPKECFEFAETAFDLAEEIQTLVVVLSDLDIGMNLWQSDRFETTTHDYRRGKLLGPDELAQMEKFGRYLDVDGDGICYRTLPGTNSLKAGYFTRGTGHNEYAGYSEDGVNYEKLLARLKRKMETARRMVPENVFHPNEKTKTLLVAYGSTDQCVVELRDTLKQSGHDTAYLRLRSYPLPTDTATTLQKFEKVIVIEQNRDGQMAQLLCSEFPELANRIVSVTQYDGMPISAAVISNKVKTALESKDRQPEVSL
jgi:2-oxoglutarate ferredoxin oxidoreductase subunit alpha